jgi:hypothetical protein
MWVTAVLSLPFTFIVEGTPGILPKVKDLHTIMWVSLGLAFTGKSKEEGGRRGKGMEEGDLALTYC